MNRILVWTPAILMAAGALMTLSLDARREMPLRATLGSVVPVEIEDRRAQEILLPEDQRRVAGVSSYLMRSYQPEDSTAGLLPFTVYIGYYQSQMQGRTIHSPKNCLPGSGWEALSSTYDTVFTAGGPVRVNRYILQNGEHRALVFYWYQGRGRVEANEYRVKLDLLRDAALRRRSEEALVRIVVPLDGDEGDAMTLAGDVSQIIIPALYDALPN